MPAYQVHEYVLVFLYPKQIILLEVNMMKRFSAILIALLMLFVMMFGCAQPAEPTVTPATAEPQVTPNATETPEPAKPAVKLNIVSTIFPQYDWVRQILGNKAEHHDLTLLIDSRVDLHSYQPSVSDIVKIGASDLFIHVGGISDEWVNDVLRQASNPNMIIINLIDVLGDAVKLDTPIEGTQGHDDNGGDDGHHGHGHTCSSHSTPAPIHTCDSGHSHNDDCDDDCDDHHDHEDEHVWLSLQNAKAICAAIANALTALDPDNAEAYQTNLTAYVEKLSALNREYQAAANAANVTTLVFADRFPFRYLMDDYGLNYYAAFSGCSAETEASFSTIVFLARKVDELDLNYIMVTESANLSIAETVISSTAEKNQQILVLDGMKTVTRRDIDNGVTYLSIMESNLEVLKEALA
jgi:zinc transport system substrate-binding protein